MDRAAAVRPGLRRPRGARGPRARARARAPDAGGLDLPARGAHPPAQYRLPPGRRPRLGRARLLRPAPDPHPQRGPHGGRGHALHAALLGLGRLRPRALRADDRAAHRPRLHPRQRRGAARGPAPDPGGDGDHRRALEGRGLRHGHLRQVGARRTRHRGRAEPPGLRRVVRVPVPAAGAQLLPAHPVARRGARGAGGQRPRPHGRAVLPRPDRGGGARVRARPRARAVLPLRPLHHPAPGTAGPGRLAGRVRGPVGGPSPTRAARATCRTPRPARPTPPW